MTVILTKPTVLVLNRLWQPIHVNTPAETFCMLASDSATALDIFDGYFLPTKWSDWLALSVREHDAAVNTPRGRVRVPTVIVATTYTKVPLRRPRFGLRDLGARSGHLPIHRSQARPSRRQYRSRRAALTRRPHLVGELRACTPRGELA